MMTGVSAILRPVGLGFLLISVVLVSLATNGVAQTPGVRVYFDSNLDQWEESCKGYGVLDTLYVVAEHFGTEILQIEYSVSYPPHMFWLTDMAIFGTTVGQTPTGIVHFWDAPADASGQLVLAEVLIFWNCDFCDDSLIGIPLCVNAHPGTTFLRGMAAGTGQWIFAEGWGATLCPTVCLNCPPACGASDPIICEAIPSVPIGQTTWGAIKELYQ